MIGELAGSYRILDVLSVGGMGTVYRAEHTLIGRLAAVKILNPEMSTNRDIINRFFNEARATTSIKHPGIVEVFDFGYLPAGQAYLVMELLDGQVLSARNRARGPVTEGEAAALIRSVCSALAAAHAKGIVHRDLKPDNIFLVPDAEAPLGARSKLLDFGIAKLSDVGLAGTGTRTGAVMGTPTYMSPEQCKGTGDVDHRADLYSLGCIFYELVTGRPPFTDRGAGELIGAHLYLQPEPPSKYVAGMSADTEALIMALLAKQPEHRPQSAVELGQLLAPIAQRAGFASAMNWEQLARLSAPILPTPMLPTPAHVAPTIAGEPTTLSGAASQTVAPPPRPSRKRVVAVACLSIVAGAILLAVTLQGGNASHGVEPAAQPIARPAPAPPPVAASAPVVAPPAPAAPTPPPPAPVAPKVEPPPPVADKVPVVKKPATPAKAHPPKTAPRHDDHPLLETDVD